ncbi:unnamed protein product [Amoebophrya sp. A25]|nr:unnamed protein product [Amoebophrya sp. A25]|eukprot:GSA25T00018162001.1
MQTRQRDIGFSLEWMGQEHQPEEPDHRQMITSDSQLFAQLLDCHHAHLGNVIPPWHRQMEYYSDVFFPSGGSMGNVSFNFDLYQLAFMQRYSGTPQRFPKFESEILTVADPGKYVRHVRALGQLFSPNVALKLDLPSSLESASGGGEGHDDTLSSSQQKIDELVYASVDFSDTASDMEERKEKTSKEEAAKVILDKHRRQETLRVWASGMITGKEVPREFASKLAESTYHRLATDIAQKSVSRIADIVSDDGTWQTESWMFQGSRQFVHVNSLAQCDHYCALYFTCVSWTVVVQPGTVVEKEEQILEPREYHKKMRRKETEAYLRKKQKEKAVDHTNMENMESAQEEEDQILIRDRRRWLYNEMKNAPTHDREDLHKLVGSQLDFRWTAIEDGALDHDEDMIRKLMLFPQKATGLRCFLKRDDIKALAIDTAFESRVDLKPLLLSEEDHGEEEQGSTSSKKPFAHSRVRNENVPLKFRRQDVGLWSELQLGRRTSKRHYFSGVKLINMPFQYVYLPTGQMHKTRANNYFSPWRSRTTIWSNEPCYRARMQSPLTPSYRGDLTVLGSGGKRILVRDCDTAITAEIVKRRRKYSGK